MIENESTDESPRPGERPPDDEPATEAGRPLPSQLPSYPRPQAVPDPPPAPAAQPPPQPQPQAPQQPQPYYPPQPAYQYPAPVVQPPPQTVQGGGGTLWLRPDSGVHPAPAAAPPPAPPGGAYLGAPVHNPYTPYPGYPPPAYVPAEPSNGKAVAALVLGIVGLLFLLSGLGILFFINLPCSILAWIFGVQGQRAVDKGLTTRGDGMAKTGFWMGLVGTILGVVAIVIWVVAIAASS